LSLSGVKYKKTGYKLKENRIEFQNVEEIKFPKICTVCGANTEKTYKKTIYGSFVSNKDYKNDYYFDIPVCEECTKDISMKTGISSKYGIIVLLSSLLGIILAMTLYFLYYSILISISVFVVPLIVSCLYYRSRTRNKIQLDEFLEIKISLDKSSLIFEFYNQNYAKFVNEINLTRKAIDESQEEMEKTS